MNNSTPPTFNFSTDTSHHCPALWSKPPCLDHYIFKQCFRVALLIKYSNELEYYVLYLNVVFWMCISGTEYRQLYLNFENKKHTKCCVNRNLQAAISNSTCRFNLFYVCSNIHPWVVNVLQTVFTRTYAKWPLSRTLSDFQWIKQSINAFSQTTDETDEIIKLQPGEDRVWVWKAS